MYVLYDLVISHFIKAQDVICESLQLHLKLLQFSSVVRGHKQQKDWRNYEKNEK